jgi:hypothetical protein
LLPDDAHRDRRVLLVKRLQRFQQPIDVPGEQGMVGCIQLRRTDAGGETAKQLVIEREPIR